MANTSSASKRARQTGKRNRHRAGQRSALRTIMKKAALRLGAGDRAGAELACRQAVPIIDSLCGKGVIHKNKAARYKSRLHRNLRTLLQQD